MKIFLFLIGLVPSTAFANTLDTWGSSNEGVAGMWKSIRGTLYTKEDPVAGISSATVGFIFPLIGSAAVLMIIYAAIRMITAQGKDDVISESKDIILHALAGVILALLGTTVILFFSQEFFPKLFQ